MLSFKEISDEDLNMVGLIVDRVKSVSRGTNSTIDKAMRSDLIMNLAAYHMAYPLRLDDLYKAPDFDLLHDIHGIHCRLSKETRFTPRYTIQLSEEQDAEILGYYLIHLLALEVDEKGKVDTQQGERTPLELGRMFQLIIEEKLYLEDSK